MKDFVNRFFLFVVFFGSTSLTINAQEGWEDIQDRESYLPVSELTEGIYRTFEEFKANSPSISAEFELRTGTQLFIKDTGNVWLRVNNDTIWGCLKNGTIYIAKNQQVWRCLNVGRLLHFSTIYLRSVYVDPMNSSMQDRYVEVISQFFLDTETSNVFPLNSRTIRPYVEQESDLKNYKMDRKSTKEAQTILYLKAYNELNPLKIKPNE